MYNGLDIYKSSNYIIHRCGEGDINKLVEIFNLKNRKSYLNHILNKNTHVRKLYLRDKLFNYAEEFYILEDISHNVLALIGLCDVSNIYIYKYNIDIIEQFADFDINILINFIDKCMENIKNEICKDCYKFNAHIESNNAKLNEFIIIMNELSFKNVGYLKNEHGLDINEIIFERELI